MKNEFYTWSNPAENISYTGVLISEDESNVVLLTKHGEFTIPRGDGEFTEATQQDYFFAPKPEVIQPVQATTKTPRSGTKTAQAKQAIDELAAQGLPKANIIAHLELLLNITNSNASVYYHKLTK